MKLQGGNNNNNDADEPFDFDKIMENAAHVTYGGESTRDKKSSFLLKYESPSLALFIDHRNYS
jgi:hypothetical protein